MCLIQHNYYRSLHGAQPLRCDPELAKSAQAWSRQEGHVVGTQKHKFTHSYGRNIAWKSWAWKGMGKMRVAIPYAVRSWYSELKNDLIYNDGSGIGNMKHFRTVVRSDERRLGCGIHFQPGHGTYVTAHYGLANSLQGPNIFSDPAPPITIHKRKPLGKLKEHLEQKKSRNLRAKLCLLISYSLIIF